MNSPSGTWYDGNSENAAYLCKKKFLIFKKEDFKNLENYHSLFQKWHRHFAVQLSLVFPISWQWARKGTNSFASQGELLSFELSGKGRDQNGGKKKPCFESLLSSFF